MRINRSDVAGPVRAAELPQEEIGLRLFEIPAFRSFTEQVGGQVATAMGLEAAR
jgi:hypothetical protein